VVDEPKLSPGLLIWPNPKELWVGDPEAMMAGADWIKLDRTTAQALHREIGRWLSTPEPEPVPEPVDMDGRAYREECFQRSNSKAVLDPWETLSAETKKYWNKLAKSPLRWNGNE
jgi:hypothetical protein